jgi:hypothetical protein
MAGSLKTWRRCSRNEQGESEEGQTPGTNRNHTQIAVALSTPQHKNFVMEERENDISIL